MSEIGSESAPKRPHIGAFVLETLTLGMYGEPRHTLREYVQNSFDSIRTAQRLRFLTSRGRVEVVFDVDEITIRDNGLGVSAEHAWSTLTSIGASKKARQRDAGFRGIGRLAGMAYCDRLTFRTTFPAEKTVTTVSFDCTKLLAAMNPDLGGDMELSRLLAEAVTFHQDDAAQADDHFFEVKLTGLSRAPEQLRDPATVSSYLSETVPVGFAPDWSHRREIESAYQSYFGAALETIDVFVHADNEVTPIHKLYGDTYERAQDTAQLVSIQFLSSPDSNFWGWVGRLSGSGAVTDPETRGLRVRVRNIQVDGTELFEGLFARHKPSYGRFNAFYVGEIHIEPARVVPNARRDGFEEDPSWLSIQRELIESVCEPLAREAYRVSNERQSEVGKIVEEIEGLVHRASDLSQNPRTTYDQVVDLMIQAKRLRRKAASALKGVDDLDQTHIDQGGPKEGLKAEALQLAARNVESVESQARMLIGRYLDEEQRISGLKARLRQEIAEELLGIVNAFVDGTTYQKIRRQFFKATDTLSPLT